METLRFPAPETAETIRAKRALIELEREYREKAEPYLAILVKHAEKDRILMVLEPGDPIPAGVLDAARDRH